MSRLHVQVVVLYVVVLSRAVECVPDCSQLFGEEDPDQDVSPDTADPEAAGRKPGSRCSSQFTVSNLLPASMFCLRRHKLILRPTFCIARNSGVKRKIYSTKKNKCFYHADLYLIDLKDFVALSSI